MIAVLPESQGNVLGVRASDHLTDEDYRDVWIPKLEGIIKAHGSVRVLLYMDKSFRGWEAKALWEETKFGLQNISSVVSGGFQKIALVGGPGWAGTAVELFGYLMPGEVKTFPDDALDEAWSWIEDQ